MLIFNIGVTSQLEVEDGPMATLPRQVTDQDIKPLIESPDKANDRDTHMVSLPDDASNSDNPGFAEGGPMSHAQDALGFFRCK